ncbi:hypothetical protein NRY68_14945 [Acidithiobacillus ferrooxidans]|uniref:hypothetical protein n=2 Tax=Acidithiobacillus ferrooxidans TaxID=920 RepID=UPI0021477F16|nr:hypothetical protein [Acidithiobacillus ferrooxidans]MCR1347055.1 hypothetical protein [Acidithiobacillus ferrooxidans]
MKRQEQVMAGNIVIEDDRLHEMIMGNIEIIKLHCPEMNEAEIIETALTRMQMQIVAATPNPTGRYRNILEVFQDFGI